MEIDAEPDGGASDLLAALLLKESIVSDCINPTEEVSDVSDEQAIRVKNLTHPIIL